MNETAFGLLVVDKPVGPTSHDVVARARKGTGIRKVGHTGTLDPLASGVLVLCLGPATRLSEFLIASDKEYRAVVRFGSTTDTYDSEGSPLETTGRSPSTEKLQEALVEFEGKQEQTPPRYSAVKVAGKRAYQLARAGQAVEIKPRTVEIHSLEVLRYSPPDLELHVRCSSGTYLRSLAHDLGQAVGTGAFLADLRRTRAGRFRVEQAVALEALEKEFQSGDWRSLLIPAAQALPEFPVVNLDQSRLEEIRHGRPIPSDGEAQGLARAIAPDGELAAVLRASEDGSQWKPSKVFMV